MTSGIPNGIGGLRFHVVFLDEDRDLITSSFATAEERDDFVAHFEDFYEDDDGNLIDDDSPYWRFGYIPKHVTFEGTVEQNHGS